MNKQAAILKLANMKAKKFISWKATPPYPTQDFGSGNYDRRAASAVIRTPEPVSSPATSQTPYLESEMGKSLSQLEATQAVAVALQRQITDLEQQRDAALKLANKWELDERYSSVLPRHALSDCARELRAIFAPKEGK